MLDRAASSGDATVKRQATWRMSIMTESEGKGSDILERFTRHRMVRVIAIVAGLLIGLEATIGAINTVFGVKIPPFYSMYKILINDNEARNISILADEIYFETSNGEKSVSLYEEAARSNDPYAQAMMAKIFHHGFFNQGKDEKRARDFALASLNALEAGSHDDPRYAYALGYLFQHGIGVTKDSSRAISLYEFGAMEGHAPSQSILGLLYDQGIETKEDDESAFSLYLSAAEQGHRAAMLSVGLAYRFGWGINPSPQRAAEWLEKAANLGTVSAQAHLGELYEQGELGQPNLEIAENWYAQAASKGEPFSLFKSGALQWNRGDKQAALAAFREAASQGQPDAQYNLGLMYENPSKFDPDGQLNLERDLDTSLSFMRSAASGGSVFAQKILAGALSGGLGGKYVEFSEAFENAQKCAAANSDVQGLCQFRVAYFYEHGLGVERNLETAIEQYEAALVNGVAAAARNLADVFSELYGNSDILINQRRLDYLLRAVEMSPTDGSIYAKLGHLYKANLPGIPGDMELAAKAFLMAAENGSANGACNIGFCLLRGQGVEKNLEESVRWLSIAAETGLTPPLKNLYDIITNDEIVGMTIDDLAEIRDRGLARMAKRAETDGCTANLLGQRYERGDAAQRDVYVAAKWYEKAASLGSMSGAYNFGRLNLVENMQNANPVIGLEWLKKAADEGSGAANLLLSSIHYSGNSVVADENKAMDYLLRAKKLDAPLSPEIGSQVFPDEWIIFYTGRVMSCEGVLQAPISE